MIPQLLLICHFPVPLPSAPLPPGSWEHLTWYLFLGDVINVYPQSSRPQPCIRVQNIFPGLKALGAPFLHFSCLLDSWYLQDSLASQMQYAREIISLTNPFQCHTVHFPHRQVRGLVHSEFLNIWVLRDTPQEEIGESLAIYHRFGDSQYLLLQ